MNINFTQKELQVIQLMVPEMTPEATINKVLRDWFNANVPRLQTQATTTDKIVDDILSVNSKKLSALAIQ